MPASAGGSRLFHAIVVMGLSFGAGACGGTEAATASSDAGRDATGRNDAASGGSSSGGGADGASTSDAISLEGASTQDAADAGGAVDASSDAYGFPDDAGNCVCPGSRPAQPCCLGLPACSWPCYV